MSETGADSEQLTGVVQALLPAHVVAYLSCDPADAGSTATPEEWEPLPAEERAATVQMRPVRYREFWHGRHCARVALRRLGLPSATIPVGARREPLWPAGVVGSISHCGPYALAAVSSNHRYAGLGIDLEHSRPAIEPRIREMVCIPVELARLAWLRDVDPGRMIFSAKESIYKCLWPLTGRFLDFHDIELLPAGQTGGFRARYAGPGSLAAVGRIEGRFALAGALVVSASWIAREAPGGP